jgi:uncharacterized protein (TIGR02996 family)
MNEDAFLAALHDSPDDGVTWLALADWIDEHDQPQRAELVRVVRQLRAQPPDAPGDAPPWKSASSASSTAACGRPSLSSSTRSA